MIKNEKMKKYKKSKKKKKQKRNKKWKKNLEKNLFYKNHQSIKVKVFCIAR